MVKKELVFDIFLPFDLLSSDTEVASMADSKYSPISVAAVVVSLAFLVDGIELVVVEKSMVVVVVNNRICCLCNDVKI